MSRADGERVLPPPPRIRRVLRGAIGDLYYNSWRFLGGNLVLGAVLVAVLLASVGSALALLLLPVAAVPAAGLMRMAVVLVRDGHTDFGDFTDVVRRPWLPLAAGVVQSLVCVVLLVDMQLGGAIGGLFGAFLTVSAIYGLVIGWVYAAAAWPLLLDPERHGEPIPKRLRLAAIALVAHPLRVGAFLLVVGMLLGLSALVIAPFLTFTVALAWLVIARFLLPVADRIEGRATLPAED